jgi:hypothetical protein
LVSSSEEEEEEEEGNDVKKWGQLLGHNDRKKIGK